MNRNQHKCPVATCEEVIPRKMAFCKRHWFQLPKTTRDNIWKLFESAPGSMDHLEALVEARKFLEARAAK